MLGCVDMSTLLRTILYKRKKNAVSPPRGIQALHDETR